MKNRKKVFKIKPSSLSTFNNCDRCRWMQFNDGWRNSSLRLAMNSVMSNQIEESLRDQPTEQFIPELGEGVITETKKTVSTGMLPIKGSAAFYIAGQFDHIAKLKDGTYAVIDDKTKASVKKYSGEHEAETYRSTQPYVYK